MKKLITGLAFITMGMLSCQQVNALSCSLEDARPIVSNAGINTVGGTISGSAKKFYLCATISGATDCTSRSDINANLLSVALTAQAQGKVLRVYFGEPAGLTCANIPDCQPVEAMWISNP